jgi:hypothetical protein
MSSWDKIIAFGFVSAKTAFEKGPLDHGLHEWNKFKTEHQTWNDYPIVWSETAKNLEQELNLLLPKTTDSKEDALRKHFYSQLGAIPQKQPTMMRLVQIAYNLGQLTYTISIEPKFFSAALLEFYSIKKLRDIKTYIEEQLPAM